MAAAAGIIDSLIAHRQENPRRASGPLAMGGRIADAARAWGVARVRG
jgi:hypothetical protein